MIIWIKGRGKQMGKVRAMMCSYEDRRIGKEWVRWEEKRCEAWDLGVEEWEKIRNVAKTQSFLSYTLPYLRNKCT